MCVCTRKCKLVFKLILHKNRITVNFVISPHSCGFHCTAHHMHADAWVQLLYIHRTPDVAIKMTSYASKCCQANQTTQTRTYRIRKTRTRMLNCLKRMTNTRWSCVQRASDSRSSARSVYAVSWGGPWPVARAPASDVVPSPPKPGRHTTTHSVITERSLGAGGITLWLQCETSLHTHRTHDI